MTDSYRALVVDRRDGAHSAGIATLTEADLPDGEVTVRIDHSCLNYKDGLALTGRAPIFFVFPQVPGARSARLATRLIRSISATLG